MKKAVTSCVVLAIGVAMLVTAGCKKKQPEMSQMPPQQMPGQMPPGGQPGMGMGGSMKIESTLVVPEEVKKKWKAVKLNLTDKTSNKSSVFSAAIGKETSVPGTDMKVYVEAFLPAFKMDAGTISSMSPDQTTNPAVKIKVTEKGQEVFKGWLFELYPTVHPFNHPKYTMSLAGYEKN